MNDQQLCLLTSLMEQHHTMAVMLAYYYQDKRKVRIVLFYSFPMGAGYVQYPIEY